MMLRLRFLEDADLVEQERDDIHRILTSDKKGLCELPFPIDSTVIGVAEDETGCSYGHRSSIESLRGETEQYSSDNRRSPTSSSELSTSRNVHRPVTVSSGYPTVKTDYLNKTATFPPPSPYDMGSPKKYANDFAMTGGIPASPFLPPYAVIPAPGFPASYANQPAATFISGWPQQYFFWPYHTGYMMPQMRTSAPVPVATGSSQMGLLRMTSTNNNAAQIYHSASTLYPISAVYQPQRFSQPNVDQYQQPQNIGYPMDNSRENLPSVASSSAVVQEEIPTTPSHINAHSTTSDDDHQQIDISTAVIEKPTTLTQPDPALDDVDQIEDDRRTSCDSPTIVIDTDQNAAALASRQRASAMMNATSSAQTHDGTAVSSISSSIEQSPNENASALSPTLHGTIPALPSTESLEKDNIFIDRSSTQSPIAVGSDGDATGSVGLLCSPPGTTNDTDASTMDVYYDAEDKPPQQNSRTPSESDKDYSNESYVAASSALSVDLTKSPAGSINNVSIDTGDHATSSSAAQQKSWASLFSNKSAVVKKTDSTNNASNNRRRESEKSRQEFNLFSSDAHIAGSDRIMAVEQDAGARKLADILRNAEFVNRGPTFVLRGIVNRGNWCYVNACLHALMACPPFYHFLRNLSPYVQRPHSSTPLLDTFVRFAMEFPLVERGRITNSHVHEPVDPAYFRTLITRLRSDATFKGRQEDAEEFLLQVFNALHDEMVSCLSLLEKNRAGVPNHDEIQNGQSEDPDSSEWQQVGPGRKAAITRQTRYSQSPLSQLFLGQLRYGLSQAGGKESANLEPFYTLPLDIQAPGITNISTALQMFTSKEKLRNYTGKNKTEVDATRHVTFLELPRVLIFQLKYFIYTDEGLKKMLKPIDFSMDLCIDRELLFNRGKATSPSARQYKLFAVIFHHGEKAEGGHYTVDIFHGGQWNHVDDETISLVKNDHVLSYQPPRVPYLLFYRRWDSTATDTQHQQQSR